jgi:hypothetical protein
MKLIFFMVNTKFNGEEGGRREKEKKEVVDDKPSFKTPHTPLHMEEGVVEL